MRYMDTVTVGYTCPCGERGWVEVTADPPDPATGYGWCLHHPMAVGMCRECGVHLEDVVEGALAEWTPPRRDER